MLQQLTPAIVVTFYEEKVSGRVVKMEDGQAKNQPASVSFDFHLSKWGCGIIHFIAYSCRAR